MDAEAASLLLLSKIGRLWNCVIDEDHPFSFWSITPSYFLQGFGVFVVHVECDFPFYRVLSFTWFLDFGVFVPFCKLILPNLNFYNTLRTARKYQIRDENSTLNNSPTASSISNTRTPA
jgi:hypothetical protein